MWWKNRWPDYSGYCTKRSGIFCAQLIRLLVPSKGQRGGNAPLAARHVRVVSQGLHVALPFKTQTHRSLWCAFSANAPVSLATPLSASIFSSSHDFQHKGKATNCWQSICLWERNKKLIPVGKDHVLKLEGFKHLWSHQATNNVWNIAWMQMVPVALHI